MEPPQERSSNKYIGIFYAVIVLIGNGFHPIINNSRPSDVNSFTFTMMMSFWEFLMGTLLNVIMRTKRQKPPHNPNSHEIPLSSKRQIRAVWILTGVGLIFSIATILYVEGMTRVGAIPSSIALKTSPIYAIIIGYFFLHETLNLKQIALTVLMLVGLYYLGTEGTWALGEISHWFVILIFVPALWTIGHTFTKPLLVSREVSPQFVIFVRSGVILLVCLVLSLVLLDFADFWAQISNPSTLFYSFLMGGTYFLMHLAWYNSLKTISISYASALVTPSPIITALFAMVILRDPFHLYQIWGISVCLLSLYGLIWLQTKKKSN